MLNTNFIEDLKSKFQLLSVAQNAQAQQAYMKNKFKFFGIYTKERDAISKEQIKTLGILPNKELIAICKKLYKQPERDFHYAAIDIVAFHKKYWNENIIELIEYLLVTNSWWDSVDTIASELVAPYFQKFPHQISSITEAWNNNNNMWLQRVSIIFQNKYKQNTDTQLLAKYILHCKKSNEFFIQKAIGWALREYAKTNSNWVTQFTESNELPALSKREALKHSFK